MRKNKRGLFVILLVIATLVCCSCGTAYKCGKCGTTTRDAYYDPFNSDRYYCASCAKEYFAPLPYKNYSVD